MAGFLRVAMGGVGHGYFSAEKFRDPASRPSALRLSTPQVRSPKIKITLHEAGHFYFCGDGGS